jgi:hypothetical protein
MGQDSSPPAWAFSASATAARSSSAFICCGPRCQVGGALLQRVAGQLVVGVDDLDRCALRLQVAGALDVVVVLEAGDLGAG